MVDVPGNASTGRTIAVGETITETLELAGDHDWYRIQLTQGQEISVLVEGLLLSDPYVRIRNSAGTILYQNDDGGEGLDSLVAFQATYTGAYYIDVGSAPENQTGTYELSVDVYTLPPVGTLDEIAHVMTHDFWGGDVHHFDVSQGRTITVNLTGLTADSRTVARAALQLWTDVIAVNFVEVTTGGQIVFDDSTAGTGAFSESEWSNGITTWATVNVSADRLGTGPGIIREGLQTYIHEIGHALGLGHSGDYNGGTAFSRYPYEATHLNDGWAVSLMSYFDNGENDYYQDLGFTHDLVVTPQLADIIAMAELYGLSTTTQTGNTTYGFNNNSGREVFDAALHPNVAYTIIDSGGIDTLDYSGFGNAQLINLNAEAFSNIGPNRGNVAIARGTVIENAIGGGGADIIIGNSVANTLMGNGGIDQLVGNGGDDTLTGNAAADSLTGNDGNDTFRDTALGLNGDTITDFRVGDRIVITNANIATFTFNLTGTTLTYSGGSLTLGASVGRIIATAAAGGGVQLTLIQDAANDFNGDGRSDILFRHDNGAITNFLGTANGGILNNGDNVYTVVDNAWDLAATGDFNGDGRDDVLWRNDSGAMFNFLGTANGGVTNNGDNSFLQLSASWTVSGAGDFNGDGKDDILFRDANGVIFDYLGTASGGFTGNTGNLYTDIGDEWHVSGVGDFNGDGRDDILFRNENGAITNFLGTANGGILNNGDNIYTVVGNAWHIAGVGDFNGDGRDDLLWRNDNGAVFTFLSTANGGVINNGDNSFQAMSNVWHVEAIGDYNGDSRDDILWRLRDADPNSDGTIIDWLGTASGGFTDNSANLFTQIAIEWQVMPPAVLI